MAYVIETDANRPEQELVEELMHDDEVGSMSEIVHQFVDDGVLFMLRLDNRLPSEGEERTPFVQLWCYGPDTKYREGYNRLGFWQYGDRDICGLHDGVELRDFEVPVNGYQDSYVQAVRLWKDLAKAMGYLSQIIREAHFSGEFGVVLPFLGPELV
jgi:hypothetical protein